jgi:hypothetical protein
MQQILYYSEVKDPVVNWVFKFFSTAIGCAFRPTAEVNLASVVYTNMRVKGDQLRIPVWHGYYDGSTKHTLDRNGYWVPVERRDSEAPIDCVGLVFRLLTFTDELAVPDAIRDPFGNLSPHLTFPRLDFRDRPMVDVVVAALKQQLVERNILRESDLLAKWPNGKRYAILFTHDTDGPCLLEPKELIKAGAKGFIKFNKQHRQAFLHGCKCIVTGQPDPYFNFVHWAEFEQSLDAQSAFYIYINCKGVPYHTHNPLYVVSKSKTKWHVLRELADRGWEIGLHASIHALEKDEYIQAEKRGLEDVLGEPVTGNRCHYWCLDWRNPVVSFRRLVAAGFVYDCSVAWKDAPGFRGGTALPYHPYDPQSNSGFELLEIPSNLMDGHLFEYQANSHPNNWFTSIADQVRAHGGVLNLDWHTRTWVDRFAYAGWRNFIVNELTKLAAGDVWLTTPKKLTEHWLLRERQLVGEGEV